MPSNGTYPICPGPVEISGYLDQFSNGETGRVASTGSGGTCASPKSCPGLVDTGAAFHYNYYHFENNTGHSQCVDISLVNTCSGNVNCVVYSTYDYYHLCDNFLADMGNIAGASSGSCSITVSANQTFDIIVHDLNTNNGCGSYTLTVTAPDCTYDQSLDDQLTTSTGWSQFGTATANQSTGFDGAHTALLANIHSVASSAYRIIGWITNANNTLPYQATSDLQYLRGKFYVFASGQTGSAVNQIPNFRLRIANRFAVTSLLTVNNHLNSDPEATNLAQDIRPSTSPTSPSLYRLDFDPIDVPKLVNSPYTEGFLRAFEVYESDPQANGNIALTENVLGTYPKLPDSDTVVAVTQNGLIKRYIPGVADGGDFGNGNIASSNSAATVAKYYNGALEATGPQPGFTINNGGVTLQTLSVESDRFGVAAIDVFNTKTDLTNHLTRARVEPGKQYKVRFHATANKTSSNQAVIRFRARTLKFQYTSSLEIGGATGASVNSNTIAVQALPGFGNAIPEADRLVYNEPGGLYNVLLYTPMTSDIQTTQPRLYAQDGPGVDTQPANNSKSRRDLQFGFDVIDTFSTNPTSGAESGQVTVNRVDIEKYDAVAD